MELTKLESKERIQLARVAAKGTQLATVSCNNVNRRSLPAYQDGEDMAVYLSKSEKVAQLLDANKENYDLRLGGLLSG